MREQPIVVTGASGHVGRLVAEQLLEKGHAVRVIARNAQKLEALARRGADVRTGALADRSFLASVFRGAGAVFLLTPVDLGARDVNAEQTKNVRSAAAAIRDAGVEQVVLLSSWGAELTERSGGIIGCHLFEELLDGIPGLNVVHLRTVWFMENLLWNIPLIKMAGINGSVVKANVPFPTLATRDIAPVAVDYLARQELSGRTIRYLNGPRDYTMAEITRTLGEAIQMPSLRYAEFPVAVMRKGLIDSGGLSPNAADLAIAINEGINSGHIKAEPRSPSNTTPTTLEEFAKTTFAPAFAAAPEPRVGDRLGGFFLRSLLFVTGHRAA